MNYIHILTSIAALLSACSGNKADHQDSRTAASHPAAANETAASPKPAPVDEPSLALSGLPEWCSTNLNAAGESCVTCNRPTSLGSPLAIPAKCFKPIANFDPSKDCGLAGEVSDLKTISCKSVDGGMFAMDVSFASEKAAKSLPLLMFAVSAIADKQLKDHPDDLALVKDFSLFITTKLPDLMAGNSFDAMATDLVNLVGKRVKTPLTESQKSLATTGAVVVFKTIKADLESKQSFSVVSTAGKLMALARLVPGLAQSPANAFFEGKALADMVALHRSEVDGLFTLLKSDVMGVTSTDDLIAQLKALP